MLPPLKLRSSSDEASPFFGSFRAFFVVTKKMHFKFWRGMWNSEKNDWEISLVVFGARVVSRALESVDESRIVRHSRGYIPEFGSLKNPGPQRSPVYHCLRNNNKKSRSVQQLQGASGMCPQLLHHWMGKFGVIWHRKCRWNPIFKKMCASELYQNLRNPKKISLRTLLDCRSST